jgi:hypothetical protein
MARQNRKSGSAAMVTTPPVAERPQDEATVKKAAARKLAKATGEGTSS